jgi:hypothetical protein
MELFLRDCIYKIAKNTDDISKETIIIPNKRASVYIRKYIAEFYKKPVWSPTILTIDEWVKKKSEKEIVTGNELIFLFYKVYRSLENDLAESFDKFMNWARILLKDFDEIDRYLIEPEDIFRDLRNIKELEEWTLEREEIKFIGKYEEKFLGFWDKILDFYKALSTYLKENNLVYPGRAYKEFALLMNPDEYSQIHFIGFNALSASEQMIIQKLVQRKKAEVYFDMDKYFVENTSHEAGRFFRDLESKWRDIPLNKQVKDYLTKGNRKFETIASADQVAQVNIACQKLVDFAEIKELDQTAIVLADENLIDPLLRSLPKGINEANITMGLPIRRTSIKNITELLFTCQEHILKFGGKSLYHKDLIQLFDLPIVQKSFSKEDKQQVILLQKEILQTNRKFLEMDQVIEKLPSALKENHALIQKWDFKNLKFLDAYIDFSSILLDSKLLSDLEKETVFLLIDILKKLKSFLEDHKDVEISYSIFKRLLNDEINNNQVDFLGNPTEGLQIMGILETRLLDFKNLIFIGFNEGVLPAGNYSDSVIPKDLKIFHQLPVQSDKDAIFAHHFYRLTLRAENVYSIYYTKTDMTSTGEKSRYLMQIELEYPRLNPNNIVLEKTYKPHDKAINKTELVITKDDLFEEKLDDLFEKGLSPTALNTYLSCEMDFYYRYILKFREEDKVEEDIEHSTFGSIVHEVLENLYLPVEGKLLTIQYLQDISKLVDSETEKAFANEFGKRGYAYGTNQLAFRVVKDYVHRFIKAEIQFLKDNAPKTLRIIKLEESLRKEYEWEIGGKKRKICFQGKADRVDEFDGVTRIIDYKTGKCEPKDLKVNNDDVSSLLKSDGKKFMVQVMLYDLMKDAKGNAETGIYSFRNMKEGFMSISRKFKSHGDFKEEFEEELKKKVAEIYDRTRTIHHNEKAKYCNYCKKG